MKYCHIFGECQEGMLHLGDNYSIAIIEIQTTNNNEGIHRKAHKHPNAIDGITLIHLINQIGPYSLISRLEGPFQGK